MALMKIGNTDLPEPYVYKVMQYDLDSENTGRGEDAMLHRERLRSKVYKIEAAWRVNATQLKTITDVIESEEFSMTFFDSTSSTNPTKTMYVGDRVAELVLGTGGTFWEFSTTFIEY